MSSTSTEQRKPGVKGKRIPGQKGRFDPDQPLHMTTRRASKKAKTTDGTPSITGSANDTGEDSSPLENDGARPTTSQSQGSLPSPTSMIAASIAAGATDPASNSANDNTEPTTSANALDAIELSNKQTPSPSRKRKRTSPPSTPDALPILMTPSPRQLEELSPAEVDAADEGDNVEIIVDDMLSDRAVSNDSSQTEQHVQDNDGLAVPSFEDTPDLSHAPSPASSVSGVNDIGPAKHHADADMDDNAMDIDVDPAEPLEDAEEADDGDGEADEAEVDGHNGFAGARLNKRRGGKKRRAQHQDDGIEISMRRQLELKRSFRLITRNLKDVLAEISQRTIVDLTVHTASHEQAAEYEHVKAGLRAHLDERHSQARVQLDIQLRLLAEDLDANVLVTQDKCQHVLRDIQDAYLDRAERQMLDIYHQARLHVLEDHQYDTEDEDDVIPRPKAMGYRFRRGPALDPVFDSRSRAALETTQALEDIDRRLAMQHELQRLTEHDLTDVPRKHKAFTVMERRVRDNTIAKNLTTLNMDTLTAAAEERERLDAMPPQPTIPTIPNEQAIGLQVLSDLASRPSISGGSAKASAESVASPYAAAQSGQHRPPQTFPEHPPTYQHPIGPMPAPSPQPNDMGIVFTMSPRAAQHHEMQERERREDREREDRKERLRARESAGKPGSTHQPMLEEKQAAENDENLDGRLRTPGQDASLPSHLQRPTASGNNGLMSSPARQETDVRQHEQSLDARGDDKHRMEIASAPGRTRPLNQHEQQSFKPQQSIENGQRLADQRRTVPYDPIQDAAGTYDQRVDTQGRRLHRRHSSPGSGHQLPHPDLMPFPEHDDHRHDVRANSANHAALLFDDRALRPDARHRPQVHDHRDDLQTHGPQHDRPSLDCLPPGEAVRRDQCYHREDMPREEGYGSFGRYEPAALHEPRRYYDHRIDLPPRREHHGQMSYDDRPSIPGAADRRNHESADARPERTHNMAPVRPSPEPAPKVEPRDDSETPFDRRPSVGGHSDGSEKQRHWKSNVQERGGESRRERAKRNKQLREAGRPPTRNNAGGRHGETRSSTGHGHRPREGSQNPYYSSVPRQSAGPPPLHQQHDMPPPSPRYGGFPAPPEPHHPRDFHHGHHHRNSYPPPQPAPPGWIQALPTPSPLFALPTQTPPPPPPPGVASYEQYHSGLPQGFLPPPPTPQFQRPQHHSPPQPPLQPPTPGGGGYGRPCRAPAIAPAVPDVRYAHVGPGSQAGHQHLPVFEQQQRRDDIARKRTKSESHTTWRTYTGPKEKK